ncbi:hypothetical protein X975_02149, partial [Stegodyphus mimosarum]
MMITNVKSVSVDLMEFAFLISTERNNANAMKDTRQFMESVKNATAVMVIVPSVHTEKDIACAMKVSENLMEHAKNATVVFTEHAPSKLMERSTACVWKDLQNLREPA